MFHPGRPGTESAGWHLTGCALIEFLAHAQIENSSDHGHVLNLRMRVRRNFVTVRQQEPHCERSIFGRISFEQRRLRAWRKRSRPLLPFDLARLMNRGLLLFAGLGQNSTRKSNGNGQCNKVFMWVLSLVTGCRVRKPDILSKAIPREWRKYAGDLDFNSRGVSSISCEYCDHKAGVKMT